VWTAAPGVEMTPPYAAPTLVGAVEYLGCTRRGDDNVWEVRARATLTGGRYWRFPGPATGHTGIFTSIHAGFAGQPADPNGFDGWITSVSAETGAGKPEEVKVSPPVAFHCSAL